MIKCSNYWYERVINDDKRKKMVDWTTHRFYFRISPVIKKNGCAATFPNTYEKMMLKLLKASEATPCPG